MGPVQYEFWEGIHNIPTIKEYFLYVIIDIAESKDLMCDM